MPSTYTPIATYTVSGSSTTTVTFSSIPSTYTDLVLVAVSKSSTAGANNMNIQFGDGGSGNLYSRTLLYGDGSSAGSNRQSSQPWAAMGVVANTSQNMTQTNLQIQNYSNSSTYKTMLSRCTWVEGIQSIAGLWRSTSSISQVLILLEQTYGAAYFTAGSTFNLYGIKAA